MNVNLRERWRIALLIVLIVAGGVALFLPSIGADTGPTNLQYGIQLDGGTRVRAPVDGTVAFGVNDTGPDTRSNLAEELGLDVTDVDVIPSEGAVEAYGNVTVDEFSNALAELGYEPDSVERGVSDTTRAAVVRTIESKINVAGLSGGTVQQSQAASGETFVVIEVPNANASSVRDLVRDRGVVQVVGRFPQNGSFVNETAFTQAEIAAVRPAGEYGQPPRPAVPITLTDDGAEAFATVMSENGFLQDEATTDNDADPDTQTCRYPSARNQSGYCILTVRDGNVVYDASMSEGLAGEIESGAFLESRQFQITANSLEQARDLRVDLEAGALPAPLDLEEGTSYFLSSELAQNFKFYSFLAGLIAVFAVAGVVFLRYGRPMVALPMVLTALSEVVILLGFAAAIRYPLDLSVIAGFIAVIGTGVDDLIIIADEVLTEEVSSSRVFQSRFRKALWVIGAAAATTIVAMSPLAVLSLGDLQGFAIITILGVLVGVLVTRPAYGDILRSRLTDH